MAARLRQDAARTLRIETPRWMLPLLGKARYKGAWGGRGSGKSHAFAEALVEAHVLDANRSTVCVREVQKSLNQSVKRLIEAKIEALGVAAYFEVQDTVIKSRKGDGRIIFQGMQNHTADSIKSLEGYDCAWVEEAQSLSQRSLDLLRPTIRRPGSELWFTWNPSQSTDPVDALLRGENPPPNAVVVAVNSEANPWFPDVLRAELEYDRRRDPDKFRHVWQGEYLRNSERRVFNNWRVEEFEAPKDAVIRFGADWGFAVDPTVLVRCYVEGRTLFVDYEAYMVGCEIADTPTLFATVPDSERWPIVADSARPETISHLRRNGYPKIMSAVKGPRSLEEGVEWLRSHDIVVHPRCTHLVDELTLYAYKADPLTGKVLPVLEDRDNHCIAEGELVRCERGLVPIESVTTDDRVLTRGGWRRVLFAGITDFDREIVEVKTTLGVVRCTPDHRIFTRRGFVRADALRYDDELLGEVRSCQSEWNGTAENIEGTLTASEGPTVCTGIDRSKVEELPIFIETCGNTITDRFQTDVTFITSTGTRSTTTSKTLSASRQSSTSESVTSGMRSASENRQSISTVSAIRRRLGTEAKKAARFIVGLDHWLTSHSSRLQSLAITAQPSLLLAPSGTAIAFAQTPASLLGEGQTGWTMKRAHASSADLRSLQTSTQRLGLAPARVETVRAAGRSQRVYDLTVEEHHEFVAGGVLVSNCIDALRYACEAVRRTAVAKPVQFQPPQPIAHAWRR